jgi:hypothetical protein
MHPCADTRLQEIARGHLQPRVNVEEPPVEETLPEESTGIAIVEEPIVQVSPLAGYNGAAPPSTGSFMFVQASELEGEPAAEEELTVTAIETVEVTDDGVVIDTVEVVAEPQVNAIVFAC